MRSFLFIISFLITAISFGQKDAVALIKAQQQIEKYSDVFFKIAINNKDEIQNLPSYISIDKYVNNQNLIYAYVHKSKFNELLKLQIPFEVISREMNTKSLTMATDVSEMSDWNRYPTYEVYIQMMQDFATNYPDIARLESIGNSQEGKEILVLKITDNPDVDEDEPEFFYTGQMHGNELVSSIMLLRLIDYLLANYNSDTQVDNLINTIEIWINPLANPDGLYQGGNDTVSSASRYLENGVDPNRNFPASDDDHPDSNAWAQETIDMMTFADNHHFVLSSNIHSGAEVVNYPWDEWETYVRSHADDDWWQFVSHEYADMVFDNSSSSEAYFTDVSADGITEGGDWYVIDGGRQDYMNYYKQCREFTLELSSVQFLDNNELPNHWDYNNNSFLKYMEQSLYGLRGIITDSVTGDPIEAKVSIENHDDDNSFVFSDLPIGNYHRLIYEGTYDVTYSKSGYISQTISAVSLTNYNTVTQNIALVPEGLGIDTIDISTSLIIAPNPIIDGETFITFNVAFSDVSISIFDSLGKIVYKSDLKQIEIGDRVALNLDNKIDKAVYFVQIRMPQGIVVKRIIKI